MLHSILNALPLPAFAPLAQDDFFSKWNGWPFHYGFGGDWESTLATFAFSALILGVICVFLRLLYGPRGIWRDHEMDREAEQMRQKARAELEAAYRAGRIDEIDYKIRLREFEK